MCVKDRVKLFVKSIDIGVTDFEKSINVANGYVNSISKSMGIDKINLILEKYPNLSIEWLLTGKGEMLKVTQESQEVPNVLESPNPKDEAPEYKEKYYNLLEENRELRLRIEKIDELTKALKKEIIELKQSTIKSKNTDSVLPVRLPKNKAIVQEHQQ